MASAEEHPQQHFPAGATPLLPHQPHPALTSAALHDETVLKTGMLGKRTAHTRTWQQRWFVLRRTALAYYKDASEYETRRIIPLDCISGVSSTSDGPTALSPGDRVDSGTSGSPAKEKKARATLTLYVRSRRLQLQAASEEEAQAWAQALKAALQADRQPNTPLADERRGSDGAAFLSMSDTEDESSAGPPTTPAAALTQAQDAPEKVVMQGFLRHLLHYNHHHHHNDSTKHDQPERRRLSSLAQRVRHPLHASHRTASPSAATQSGSRKMRGKRYWCVLRSYTGLYLYADEHEYEVVDILPLREMLDWTDLELPEHGALRKTLTAASGATTSSLEEEEGKDRAYVLQIIMQKESRIFAAASEAALDEWLGALQSRIEWQQARRVSTSEPVPTSA